jgi:hypothetical protein
MRATSITDYLKSDRSSLANAREMANHAETRTKQHHDPCVDVASPDEYGRVGI